MKTGLEAVSFENAEAVKLELATELLRSGRPVRLRVLGTSMLPSLWPGDLVTVSRCEAHQIGAGDIGCFVRARRLVIHRVTQICSANGRLAWITCGDCMPQADEPFTEEHLVGKIASVSRRARVRAPNRAPSWVRQGCGRVLEISVFQRLALWLYARLSLLGRQEIKVETVSG